MRIDDIIVKRSPVHDRAWVLYIEIQGFKFTGYFEDFGGFITAATEAAKFFAVRLGKLRVKDAHLTRDVSPNGHG